MLKSFIALGHRVDFRHACRRDLTGILAIVRALYEERGRANNRPPKEITDETRKFWVELLSKPIDQRHSVVLVAEVDFHIVGYIGIGLPPGKPLESGEVSVFMVSVTQAWRSKGIGRTLLEQGIEQAKTILKPRTIFLQATVANEHAIRIYEDAGFEQLGGVLRDAGMWNGQPADRVNMIKELF